MIYDCHQHLTSRSGTPARWRERMAEAGVSGGAVFSRPPLESGTETACECFEQRLDDVLDWCAGDARAYPVLFIHPSEADACSHAEEAARRGIAGFKMICNDYYVGDGPSMRLIETIAALRKPVFFHSGILWDGRDSSKYNRPVNWEALIGVKNLRFSLAHCAWPWYDECLALYGKFLHGTTERDDAPEMFFDLTPGTPEIYRRDLLFKLFYVGYDVPENILFGTDCSPNDYNADWAARWIAVDGALYDEMNVPPELRDGIYRKNFLRFMGEAGRARGRRAPASDSLERWSL